MGYRVFEFKLFRQFPGRWVLWWVVMPNIGALLLLPVGGPNIAWPMTICGVLALIVSQCASLRLRQMGMAVVFVLSAILYVAVSFNIDAERAFTSLPYMLELDPRQSPEYIVAAAVMIATLLASLRYGARVAAPRTWRQVLLAMGGLALLINVDTAATAGSGGSYKGHAPAGMPFTSAVRQAGLAPAKAQGRNVLVIMVESMGLPAATADAAPDRALFDSIWDARKWSSRYTVSRGSTPYFGSTTKGEMRELCGVWADYKDVDFARTSCLPARFAKAGYGTLAIHSSRSELFQREKWYPRFGFGQRMFQDDFLSRGAHRCGGVFPGACDRDIPRVIGNLLRQGGGKPQFVYWLTVNTHLPVPSSAGLGTQECRLGAPGYGTAFPMPCRGYALQKQLVDALTAEIMRPDFPDTDILIVGDHMPPYFQRSLRQRFDNEHVPWILLRRGAAARSVP